MSTRLLSSASTALLPSPTFRFNFLIVDTHTPNALSFGLDHYFPCTAKVSNLRCVHVRWGLVSQTTPPKNTRFADIHFHFHSNNTGIFIVEYQGKKSTTIGEQTLPRWLQGYSRYIRILERKCTGYGGTLTARPSVGDST